MTAAATQQEHVPGLAACYWQNHCSLAEDSTADHHMGIHCCSAHTCLQESSAWHSCLRAGNSLQLCIKQQWLYDLTAHLRTHLVLLHTAAPVQSATAWNGSALLCTAVLLACVMLMNNVQVMKNNQWLFQCCWLELMPLLMLQQRFTAAYPAMSCCNHSMPGSSKFHSPLQLPKALCDLLWVCLSMKIDKSSTPQKGLVLYMFR
jgi:hypothetical protein